MMEIGPTGIWIVIAIYVLLSTILVARGPGLVAPLKEGLSYSEEIEALDLQNKVRQTIIQVCGGIGFLFSIFMALSAQDSSNRALKAKYDRETAELFIKAVESVSPEALYALTHVAQRDTKNYHEEIFQMVSSLIRSLSPRACGVDGEAKEKAAAKIRVAVRLLHERAVSNDPLGISYNIEHSCLNDSDISVAKAKWGKYGGFAGIRASGSTMLRIDFSRTELQNAEFMGIAAGDRQNSGWEQEPHRYELNDLDAHGDPKWRAERRKFVAHFIDANLTDAKFNGAGLEGADFSGAKLGGAVFNGANVSRANFRGAQNLTADQLRSACVDDAKSQPVLDEPLVSQLGGVTICQ
jgi:pentapeptide repeat protein